MIRYLCVVLHVLILVYPPMSRADEADNEVTSITQASVASSNAHKSIFVFLDGTRNDPKSGTNVKRLYDLISTNNDSQTTAIYIEGVGSVDSPISGSALGHGMEMRMLRGYEFIAQNYNPGDDIYIFGFSRGAHEARSLAGLIAYAGIPKLTDNNRDRLIKVGNAVLELTKETKDKDYLDQWASWRPGQPPPLAAKIRDEDLQEMQSAQVRFLGIWDTVPGSSFKKYDDCIEKIGFFKRHFSWFPMISEGERYKSDSYPAIREIVHAVALDEKRSKFAPLLACPAMNPQYTKVSEVWFPGAHADVGGGYEDSTDLAGISLNWMIQLLSTSYKFNAAPPQVDENPQGLAHWSIGDPPANIGSHCKDRTPPLGAEIHNSVNVRKTSGSVPLRVDRRVTRSPYPMECPDH